MLANNDSITATRLSVLSALLIVYAVWGSTFFAIRLALEGGLLPFTQLAGPRYLISGLVMFCVLLWRKVALPTKAQWFNLMVVSVFLLLLGNGLVVLAESHVSSGLAATSVACVPIWMVIFGVMRGQRTSGKELLGVMIGFAGVVWLNSSSHLLTSSPHTLLLLVLSPMAWALGSVWSMGRNLPSPLMTAAGEMICGGILLLSFGFLMGERPFYLPSTHGLYAFVYLCLAGSIVGFTAFVWLLQNVRPSLAGSYAYVNPAVALALGVWQGHETLTWADSGAITLILCGVVVLTLAKRG